MFAPCVGRESCETVAAFQNHNQAPLAGDAGLLPGGAVPSGADHDLSKYSPTEFWTGARYYQGNRSPNAAEREDKGYSEAWMHHKGRNRHHYEYWTDMNRETKCYEPVPMPRRYFVEMVMDRRAACMTYQGKAYRDDSALQYFERSREKDLMHPETSRQLRFILGMLAEKGEAETFSYLRRSVLKGKPFPWEEAQDSLMRK